MHVTYLKMSIKFQDYFINYNVMKENFVFEYKIFLHYTGHSKDMSMGFQPFLSFVGLKSSKIYCNILRPFDKHVDFTG